MMAGIAERDQQIFGILPWLDPEAGGLDPVILTVMYMKT